MSRREIRRHAKNPEHVLLTDLTNPRGRLIVFATLVPANMEATERLVRTWIVTGRDEELEETVSGMIVIPKSTTCAKITRF